MAQLQHLAVSVSRAVHLSADQKVKCNDTHTMLRSLVIATWCRVNYMSGLMCAAL